MNMTSQAANAVPQDQLLLAGSKISHRDIYNQQIGLPLHRKKYYNAEEVDKVFVLINGVLTDVSKNAFRMNKSLEDARSEAQAATAAAEQARLAFEESQSLLSRRDAEIARLTNTIDDMLASNVTTDESANLELANAQMLSELAESRREQMRLASELQIAQTRLDAVDADMSTQVETLSRRVDELTAANQVLISSSNEISVGSAELSKANAELVQENAHLAMTNRELVGQVDGLVSEVDRLKADLAKASRIILQLRN